MNRYRCLLTGLVMIVWSAAAVPAANHYVRQGASGSGAGTDWTNAHAQLPSALVRGDTYYIADGSYPDYVFDDAVSGTLVITVRKATQSDHGTQTGWNSSYGDGQAFFNGDFNFMRSYYTIDGATRNESDWFGSSAYGIHAQSVFMRNYTPETAGDHIVISYCDLGAPYSQQYNAGGSTAVYLAGFSKSIVDVTVSRCFLHNWSFIQCAGVDGIVVEYTLFAAGWAKEAFRGQNTARNGIIRFCKFYNSSQTDPNEAGTGCTAEIAIWGNNELGTFDNWQIYGNIIWNDNPDIVHTGGVIVVGGNGTSWFGAPANNVRIHNNTIAGIYGGMTPAYIIINGGTGNEIRNNLWYDCLGAPSADPASSNNEVSADPFVNYAGFDFRLSAPLPGMVLSSPFDRDIDGAVRGSDGIWDRGAYEHASGPISVAPVQPRVSSVSTAAPCAVYDIKGRKTGNLTGIEIRSGKAAGVSFGVAAPGMGGAKRNVAVVQ